MKKILIALCLLFSVGLFSTTTNANPALDQIIYDHSSYEFSDFLQLLAPDQNQNPNDLVKNFSLKQTKIEWQTLTQRASEYFDHPADYGYFHIRHQNPEKREIRFLNQLPPVIMTYPRQKDTPEKIKLEIDYFYYYFSQDITTLHGGSTTSQLLVDYLTKIKIPFEILTFVPSKKDSFFYEPPALLKISFPNKKPIWLSISSEMTNRAHITDIVIFYEDPKNKNGGVK